MDIERIEAERDYMRLHTAGRSYLLHQTISSFGTKAKPRTIPTDPSQPYRPPRSDYRFAP